MSQNSPAVAGHSAAAAGIAEDFPGASAAVPRVSAVVPTYRRPDLLSRCLAALLAQDLGEPYEVVIADDGPDEATRAAVERLAAAAPAGVTLHYVPVQGAHGPAAARNAGWQRARGAVIAFTDDDTVPDVGWLRAGLAVLGGGAAQAPGAGTATEIPTAGTATEIPAADIATAEVTTEFRGTGTLAQTLRPDAASGVPASGPASEVLAAGTASRILAAGASARSAAGFATALSPDVALDGLADAPASGGAWQATDPPVRTGGSALAAGLDTGGAPERDGAPTPPPASVPASILASGPAGAPRAPVAAWGRLEMPIPAMPTDYELDASHLADAVFVTANAFCLRSALETIGGFDERFRLAWREDSDLYLRLARLGPVVHARDALVVHPVRPAPWGVSVHQQKKVLFDALLYKKHPRDYPALAGRRYAPPSYYATVAALLVAVVALVAGAPAVTGAALGLWLGLTLRFAWRRLRPTAKNPRHVAEMLFTSAAIPPLALFWRWVGAVRFRVLFV